MRRFTKPALALLLFLLVTEALCHIFDPLGLLLKYESFALVDAGYVAHPTRTLGLGDRCYEGQRWAYCVEDGARVVPDTNEDAERTLVLLGDSVLFGWGVNDKETAAYHIAQALPDWHVINTGVPAYTSEHVRAVVSEYQADALLYLVMWNDAEMSIRQMWPWDRPVSVVCVLCEYLAFERVIAQTPRYDTMRYYDDLRALHETGVILVGFDVDGFLPDYAHRIPRYTESLSHYDGHPTARGQQEIAEGVLGVLLSEGLFDG